MDRFARQRTLERVGDAGQERIARASFVSSADAEGALELEYLSRAGGVHFEPRTEIAPRFAHADFFAHAAARELAAGAWRALQQIRLVLEKGPEP